MNKQTPGIEWTHPWGRPGYTWNPIAGCRHKCRWQMPDGAIARCYAETIAEGLAADAYPAGFEHHYWYPERLDEPKRLKQPAGIFLDSMSDLMGAWVQDWQVEDVLDVCRSAQQHIFFLLTKNPGRLRKFEFPVNVWVGVSSPPDWMNGKRLTRLRQERWLRRALGELTNTRASVRWMSFEPLSWDVSQIVSEFRGALDWAVVGAASNGRTIYKPNLDTVRSLLAVLDEQAVPVFLKGNMKGLDVEWREEYPSRDIVTSIIRANRKEI